MKRFTSAGRRAIEDRNWYAALTLALIIPEICASLEDPGVGKVTKRYVNWCRKWIEPSFTRRVGGVHGMDYVFLTAEDMFQARNSVIHSGMGEIEPAKRDKLDRFEFFAETGSHMNYSAAGGDKFLQLSVEQFAETVFQAAEAWDEGVEGDAAIQAEKAKLLVIHGPGSIVGGIQFR